MTYFLRNGHSYKPTDEASMDVHTHLPAGNYTIKQTLTGEMFLEAVDKFEFRSKRYGDNIKHTDRILHTFLSRSSSTGVMLTGEKGSGKSLLAKTVCIDAYKHDIPTIIVNSAWFGDAFNTLIQKINQPAIILFDEFEKVYNTNEQEQLLTLFDGTFPSKKLFVVTCNDKWRVDSNMRNRPGRFFYSIDFKGLDKSFIVEYCNDNLKNKQHIEKVCIISNMFGQFNFDMLQALVEEMNRYDESPEDAIQLLNAKPEFDNAYTYKIVSLVKDGVDVAEKLHSTWKGNPLIQNIHLEYYLDKDEMYVNLDFSPRELVKVDNNSGTFCFKNNKNEQLTINRVLPESYNVFDF